LKTIYLLIGPKGSGKSYIGTLIQEQIGIPFLRVEDWAKAVKKDRTINNEHYIKDVFEAIEQGVRSALMQKDKVVFESTGLSDAFDLMLKNLRRDFKVITIGVKADPKTCLQRVKSRDQSIHIAVSDDQVLEINRMVVEKGMKTDYVVQNGIDHAKTPLEQLVFMVG